MKINSKIRNASNALSRKHHTRRVMHSSNTVNWSTPDWLFEALDRLFKFTLDPCSSHSNAKCRFHYTVDENGLSFSWKGHVVWLNPPYCSSIGDWMEKAILESQNAGTTVVCLIPSRTGSRWFQKCVLNAPNKIVFFLCGRLSFGSVGTPAPFDSVLVIYPGKGAAVPTPEEIQDSIFAGIPRQELSLERVS